MKLLKGFFIMSLISFLSACGAKEKYQYYNFSPIVNEVNNIKFSLRLRPYEVRPHFFGEKYSLSMTIGMSKLPNITPNCTLELKNVQLTDIKTDESINLPNALSTLKTKSGIYFYFKYDDLNLIYTDKKLEFDYTFENCNIESGKISLLLKTDYKEEQRGLWEEFLSVT